MSTTGPVYVVIPALNEAATIRALVAGVLLHVRHVVVVDDGSDDGTAQCLGDLPITLLRHSDRRGKSAALTTGMAHALTQGAAAVVTLDGDGQHRPEDLPAFLRQFAKTPGHIAIGARDIGRESFPGSRLFANRFANFWISWACGYPIKDSQCGYRLYPRAVLELVEPKYERLQGFVFESEILIDAASAGYRSVPVSIPALYDQVTRRASHFRPVTDIWQITVMVTRKLVSRGLYLDGLAAMTRQWLLARSRRSLPGDASEPLDQNAAERAPLGRRADS